MIFPGCYLLAFLQLMFRLFISLVKYVIWSCMGAIIVTSMLLIALDSSRICRSAQEYVSHEKYHAMMLAILPHHVVKITDFDITRLTPRSQSIV